MIFGLNTVLVLLSAAFIGVACSIIGVYIMLYKKSLVSDAASHATLPGIALGFFLAYAFDLNDGRFLPLLLIGGAFSGFLCSKVIEWVSINTRLYEDTAIASALAFFFGLGIVLFSIIQNMEDANKTGLDSFLFGQISGITQFDASIIIIGSIITSLIALYFGQKFVFISFDKNYARLNTKDTAKIQNLLMILMMTVVCLGLKTVGAILILALLIIPAASARLLNNSVKGILIISLILGLTASLSGSLASLYIENMPTGPAIILTLFIFFLVSAIIYKVRSHNG